MAPDRSSENNELKLGAMIPPLLLAKSFSSFADLAAAYDEGTDYVITRVPRPGSTVGIVAPHGGRIEVLSQPGQGSRFAIVLPIEVEPVHAPVAADEEPVHRAVPGTRVLYIDDDPTMAVVAQQLLERAGLLARCETDAAVAIAHLQADPLAYDVVVTDYNMPELSGTDVARAAHALRPELPVIVSSGYIDEALRECAQDGSVQGLLNKERTLEDLLPTIGNALAAVRVVRA